MFTYDNNGNICERCEYAYTSKTGEELEELFCNHFNYEYENGRLADYNGETFAYNNIGSPTTYRGKAATWEYGKLLKSYDGNTFGYNCYGQRISKNGTEYAYDNDGNIVYSSDGLEFIYDGTGVTGFTYKFKYYFYRKDAQGNIKAILDRNGKAVVKYEYDAWGNHKVTASEGNEELANLNPFRYRSYYYDVETGLYYLKSRYYDPEVGRFISQDSTEYAEPETINGLNLYAYCGNNPVMRTDSNGTNWWTDFCNWWRTGWNNFTNFVSNAAQAVGNWFSQNWDYIVGGALVLGGIVVGILSFGSGTVIAGVVCGALLGGTFGALSAYHSGGDTATGFLNGFLVGGLGGINPIAAIFAGMGMSFISDRMNGKKPDDTSWGRAIFNGALAGLFSLAGNGFANLMIAGTTELLVKGVSSFVSSFIFSAYSFVSDFLVRFFRSNE